jgi:hypothetical protein
MVPGIGTDPGCEGFGSPPPDTFVSWFCPGSGVDEHAAVTPSATSAK